MRAVVVTGVSTGIGRGIAEVLHERGYRVFGSVRRCEDAERLQRELGGAFTPIIFDVTDEDAVKRAAKAVRAVLAGETLAGLVNNAGVAFGGPVIYAPLEELKAQMEVNLYGVVRVLQAFAPLLGVDQTLSGPPGRIVNISSVGGQIGSPLLGAYSASKFALEGLSESLRREMRLLGIAVVVIAPGEVASALSIKAASYDISDYDQTPFGPAMRALVATMPQTGRRVLQPRAIGKAVARALSVRHPRARYVVAPQPLAIFAATHLPKRWTDSLLASALGLTRRAAEQA